MKQQTKKTAINRLQTATTQILSHPILPGGAAVPVIHAFVTRGPVQPALLTFGISLGVYLVGDELNAWIDAYLDALDNSSDE